MIFNVDVDGVVRDVFKPIKAIYKAFYDPSFDTAVAMQDIDITKTMPLISDVNHFFLKFSKAIFYESQPYYNSANVINELYKDNIINFISAQYKGYEYLTSLWLNNHGFEYDNLVFTKDKSIVDADFLIDDSIKNLNNPGSAIPICRSHVYNRQWTGLRIDCLEDLLKLDFLNIDSKNEDELVDEPSIVSL